MSVLYKHIIQVKNINVGLKVWGGGGTNIQLPPPPPPQAKKVGAHAPLTTTQIYIFNIGLQFVVKETRALFHTVCYQKQEHVVVLSCVYCPPTIKINHR